MTTNDTKRKVGVYGTNLGVPSLVGLLKDTPVIGESIAKIPSSTAVLDTVRDAANPYGAIVFGAIDLAGALSKKIRDSKFTRLSHVAGAGIYGVRTISDLFSIANGDYESLTNLFFDGLMVYSLSKDSFKHYKGTGKDLWDDLTKWSK
ncbi:MAG: hypothetical protein ACP5NZ_02955 [Nanobdellota archaeon]